MLDDTMGPAVFAHTDGALYTATIGMSLTYLKPAVAGPLFGESQVVQLGKTVGFVEATLLDDARSIIARATASVRLVASEKAL